MRIQDALVALLPLVAPTARAHALDPGARADADADAHRWRSLALYGADSVSLRLAPSAAHRKHFPCVGSDPKTSRPYLDLRVLLDLRSHIIVAVDMVDLGAGGSAGRAQLAAAAHAPLPVPEQSLTFVDSTLARPELLVAMQQAGGERHWVAPAGALPALRTVKHLDAQTGDALVELRVPPSLRRDDGAAYLLARTIPYHRHGVPAQVLVTSLTDPAAWPRHELTAVHCERWLTQLGQPRPPVMQPLRLEDDEPVAALDRLWTLISAYNLVREQLLSCARAAGVEPGQLDLNAAVARAGAGALNEAVARASTAPLAALEAVATELVREPGPDPVRITVRPGL